MPAQVHPPVRYVRAGRGLQGGGSLQSDVTLHVVASDTSIIVDEDGIRVNPDWAGGGGGGVTDHGALTGLADDDHPQYLLADGTRALTGNLSVAVGVTIDGRDISVDGAVLDAHIGSGGAAHALVTTVTAGFMSAADKTKLDGIASGAVADHGALAGLADDDHAQYLLIDGTRAMTGPLRHVAGSEGAPSITFDGDTNTGVYSPAGDRIAFTGNGSTFATFAHVPSASGIGVDLSPDITPTTSYTAVRIDPFVATATPSGTALLLDVGYTWTNPEVGIQTVPRFQIHQYGYARGSDGSAAAPGFSFIDDSDSGVYRSGADDVRIAAGGNEIVRFVRSGGFSYVGIPLGTNVVPGLSFQNDTDTGIYRSNINELAIATGGGQRVRFTSGDSTLTGNWLPATDNTHNLGAPAQRWANLYATSLTTTTGLFADGTMGAPSITFESDQNTGFWLEAPETLGVTADGLEVVRFRVSGGFPQILADVGTTANPSYSFRTNPDTGFQETTALGPSGVGFVVDGGLAGGFVIDGMGNRQLFAMAGSAAAPSLAIDNFDTGFYSPSGGVVSAIANQTEVFQWQAPLSADPQLLVTQGSIAAPGIAFIGDTDTGIRNPSADQIDFITGGTTRWRMTLNELQFRNGADARISHEAGGYGITIAGRVTTQAKSVVTLESNTVLQGNAVDQVGVSAQFSVNQLSTASFSGIAVNITNTALGSGAQRFVSLRISGTEVAAITNGATAIDQGRFLAGGLTGAASSKPPFSFAGDEDTGIFQSAANTLNFSLGGSERWRLSGNTLLAMQTTGAAIYQNGANGNLAIGGRVTTHLTNASLQIQNGSASTVFSATAVGTQRGVGIAYQINQVASSSGFTALDIDLTNTSLGSGTQRFIDLKAGGTTVLAITNGATAAERGRLLVSDGDAGNPSISFLSDPDTGFLSLSGLAPDVIFVTSAGSLSMGFHPAGIMPVSGGYYLGDSPSSPFAFGAMWDGIFAVNHIGDFATASFPTFTFDGASNTGMYYDGAVAFSDEGTQIAVFDGVQNTSLGTMTGFLFSASLSNTGTAGFDGMVVSVSQPLSSGSGTKRLLSLRDGATQRFAVMSATGQVQGQDGSTASPTYSFESDPDTGVYLDATGLGFSFNNSLKMRISATAVVVETTRLAVQDGLVGTPSYTFESDTASGIYLPATSQVAITTAGVQRVRVSTGNMTTTVPILANNGAVTGPTYSFSSDTNTGMYRIAEDQIGFTAGSTLALSITATEISTNLNRVIIDADSAGSSGSSGAPAIRIGGTETGIYYANTELALAIASQGNWVGYFANPGAELAHLKMNSGNPVASTVPVTNALYEKNIPKAWLKGFGLTGIDDDFAIASIASDGGTPAGVTVTFDHSVAGTYQQSIVSTAAGTTATTAKFHTVDNFAVNSCRVRAWVWSGAAIVQTNVTGDWSLHRFGTVS